jgi:hypothetical protein
MTGGVLPNQVNHGHLRPAGIVQICQAIGQARPKMKQRACRLFCHPRVAVGRARDNTFK